MKILKEVLETIRILKYEKNLLKKKYKDTHVGKKKSFRVGGSII